MNESKQGTSIISNLIMDGHFRTAPEIAQNIGVTTNRLYGWDLKETWPLWALKLVGYEFKAKSQVKLKKCASCHQMLSKEAYDRNGEYYRISCKECRKEQRREKNDIYLQSKN